MTGSQHVRYLISLISLIPILTGAARAQETFHRDQQLRTCVSESYRPNKIILCADLMNDTRMPIEQRLLAIYHHALGLAATVEPLRAKEDLLRIKAINPASEFIPLLEAEFAASKSFASQLLRPCPPPAICR